MSTEIKLDITSNDPSEGPRQGELRREDELSEAYRIARLGTWRWIRESDTVTWSAEVYKTFECDPSLPPPGYEHIQTMHTNESRMRLAAAVSRAIETGEPYELDVELTLPSGATKWITSRGEVEAWVNGEPAVLRGTIQDITERKLSELKLARSESRYRSLIRASSQIVWSATAEGAQVGELPQWQSFTGLTAEETLGFGWLDAVHPEDREATLAAWKRAITTGAPFRTEQRLRYHDGSYRLMLANAVPSYDASGNLVEWVGMHTDVTEQKLAEAALREREELFRNLAESLPQLVWMSKTTGERTYCNQRLLEYTGLASSDLLGMQWQNLIHPEDLERTVEKWTRCLQTGEHYFNEYRIRRHDGVYRSFLARAVPMRSEIGKSERWLGTATDIHDQKLAEEALRQTEKLSATGRMAASIAHEINNPLAAVTNTIYLALQDQSLSESTRHYLRTAEQELARVAHITTQTLKFHRQSTAPAWFDLSEIMESAFSLYAARFRDNSVNLVREYETHTNLYCCGDELRQVFANLISNSLDATGEGGRLRIRIRESHSWDVQNKLGIRVTIADTGHGIPLDLAKQIFQPFFSTKEATGTGLGLWVSKGIVKKHHGRIAVRSSTKPATHGTVFSIMIPFDCMGLPKNG